MQKYLLPIIILIASLYSEITYAPWGYEYPRHSEEENPSSEKPNATRRRRFKKRAGYENPRSAGYEYPRAENEDEAEEV